MIHSDTAFIIKVWDLLRNPWKLDTVVFDNVMLKDVAWLSKDGFSGTLVVQGVSDGSVKIIIKEAKAIVTSLCDVSSEPYDRIVEVRDFDARFSADVEVSEDRVYDEVFALNVHWESVDLYDFFCQSILLQEPLVYIKPWQEALWANYAQGSDDDYDDVDDQTQGNVIFH